MAKQAVHGQVGLKPLNDRVVIKPEPKEEVSASGIILPDSSRKDRAEQGTVVAVGPGSYDSGKRQPMSVAVGDTVLFSTYEEARKIDGQEYFVIPESSILAVVTK